MTDEREVVLAAWLVNIDRFYIDGASALVRKCQTLLANYLNVSVLLGIINQEDNYRKQRDIVDRAYALSLCESEKKEKQTSRRNLTSVFSRVTVSDQQQTEKRYYSLQTENVDAAFPMEQCNDSNLSLLASQFESELLSMSDTPPASWENFIVAFDTLTRKYVWCITASDYEGEDISLYNQSRIAAAIADCIVRNFEANVLCGNDELFKLVLCDFSGIQKYVFAVANVNESGVAKRLRARSFLVDMTVSVIAQDIISKFRLTQNHILLLTGGKFYLLLPNTDGAEKLLTDIEAEMEKNIFEKFKGLVAVHLAWITIGEDGLDHYSRSVLELSRRMSEKKTCGFQHVLTADNVWREDCFVFTQDLSGKKMCTSCGSELTDSAHKYCRNCQMQTEIGAKLPETKYISYYRGKPTGTFPIYGEYSVGLWKEYRDDNAFLTEQIGNDVREENAFKAGQPIRLKYMANHIPVDNDSTVMSFSEIAAKAEGTPKLAVLKADVDNLGYIFADGLRKGNRHFGTISRVNTMSRLLEIFFSGYVNELITEREEFKYVYSVFSGGDDLFLVGPWDVMPKLALTITKDFRRFAADNPALTISASVNIFHPREHIANMAEISEQCLKDVKNCSDEMMYPHSDGRDGVSFMGKKFSWDDLERQLAIGERITVLVQKNILDRGILRRIEKYSLMYQQFLRENDVMALMFEPLFHYDRQRNYLDLERKKNSDKDLMWFMEEYIPDLTKNAADSRNKKKNLYFAEAIVRYVMNRTKEDRK